MNLRSTALKITAVYFQLAAIVLLNLYAVAPLIFKPSSAYAGTIKCVGDHKKCGCSPFKVSSGTCCCFKSGKIARTTLASDEEEAQAAQQGRQSSAKHCAIAVPQKPEPAAVGAAPATAEKQKSCCAGTNSDTATASQAKTDKAIPEIKSSSCCGDPDHIFALLEKSKFISQNQFNNPPQFSSFVKYYQVSTFQDRFLEPPVPPPQLSIYS
jgi:hypothetical protein